MLQRPVDFVTRVLHNTAFQATVLLVIANGVANVCNYLYQIVMAQMLSPSDFGTLASLLAVFTVLTAVSPAFQLAAAKYASVAYAAGDPGAVRYLWLKLTRSAAIVGIALGFLIIALIPVSSWFLGINDFALWALVAATAAVSLNLPVNQGVLQGLQRFRVFALTNLATPLLKLIGGVALVAGGFGVAGALIPVLMGPVLVIAATFLLLRTLPAKTDESQTVGMRTYFGWTTVAFLGLTVLTSADVLLAKHYLSGTQSGEYAALSVLGKIILFAPVAASMVMFPKVAGEQSPEGRRGILRASLGFTVIIAGAVSTVYWVASTTIVNLTVGSAYSNVSIYLPEFGLGMALLAVSFVLMQYYLATGRDKVGFALLVAVGGQLALTVAFHESISQLTHVRLASAVMAVVAIVIYGRFSRALPAQYVVDEVAPR
jgi:O-antigen/teichoic acid export membrane protein